MTTAPKTIQLLSVPRSLRVFWTVVLNAQQTSVLFSAFLSFEVLGTLAHAISSGSAVDSVALMVHLETDLPLSDVEGVLQGH